MTDTIEATRISEALELIDRGLVDLRHRDIISSSDVADLLLDVRMILAMASAEPVAN